MVEPTDYQPLSGSMRSATNYQEFFLQGSILDINCNKLLDRLQGLCDNVPREHFTDLERSYVIKNANNTTLTAKACKAWDVTDVPWQMKYVGNTEIGDRSKSSLIRSCVTVATSKDPSKFLEDLGFKFKSELIIKGHFFRKGRIKVTVAKLHKLHKPSSPQEQSKLEGISQSHLVEVSILAPAGQDRAGDEVRQFCEHLKPIIIFDVNHREIQQKAASS